MAVFGGELGTHDNIVANLPLIRKAIFVVHKQQKDNISLFHCP